MKLFREEVKDVKKASQKIMLQYPNGDVIKTVTRKVTNITSDGYNQFGQVIIDGKKYKVSKPTRAHHWTTTQDNW